MDEIDKAKALLDRGAITQAEFDAIKAKALATQEHSRPACPDEGTGVPSARPYPRRDS